MLRAVSVVTYPSPPEVTVNCPTCATPADPADRFCASCGASLDASASPDPGATAVHDPVEPSATAVHEPVRVTAPPVRPRTGGADAGGRADVDPASTGEPLRSCPSCGAANSASRVLCGRCGVEVATGQRAVTASGSYREGPATDVTGEVGATERTAGRTATIVTSIVLGGALVGVLVGLWVVRGGGDEDEPAVFDAAVYAEEPTPLTITAVGASSTRPAAGDVSYGAENLVDGDITTAWSHNPLEEDVTDTDLALVVAEPAWVTALTFANGAQADDLAFAADGRVLRLALVVDGEAVVELQLLDRTGLQQVTLPEPFLLDEVRLVLLEAVPGDTYDEVSISEIGVIGHTARGEDLSRMLSG